MPLFRAPARGYTGCEKHLGSIRGRTPHSVVWTLKSAVVTQVCVCVCVCVCVFVCVCVQKGKLILVDVTHIGGGPSDGLANTRQK